MFKKPRAYSVATGVVRRLDRSLRNLSNTLVAVLLSLLIGCNCLAATSRADFASDAIRELYLLCQPKTAFFCENIHIGCAGRSKLATQSFYLETVRSGSVVQFKDGTRWTDETTRSLEAEQTEILLRNGQDWIRLVAKSSKVASGDKPFDFSQRMPGLVLVRCAKDPSLKRRQSHLSWELSLPMLSSCIFVMSYACHPGQQSRVSLQAS